MCRCSATKWNIASTCWWQNSSRPLQSITEQSPNWVLQHQRYFWKFPWHSRIPEVHLLPYPPSLADHFPWLVRVHQHEHLLHRLCRWGGVWRFPDCHRLWACLPVQQRSEDGGLAVRLKFSVHDICKLWSHCSHYKHDLHDYRGVLWWVLRPLFTWGDKVIDHDTNIYIEIIHGNRKERQSLLFRGIGSGPGPSSPPSCFLFLAWWLKPNTHTPGLSWPTIVRQIHDPFPCIQTTTSVQQCFFAN